ncbi:MAG: hypothetical protein L6R38_004013 [Xanthoria sp. 2 TBL-2021]|nr:MAG: hypothetical protein L6R38_004013 [Xanthoria sp. 2 TBL-2021]
MADDAPMQHTTSTAAPTPASIPRLQDQTQQQQPAEPFPTQPAADSPAPPLMNIHADIDMADAAPSPAPPPLATTPTPQRTATPVRNTNGTVDVPPPLPAKAAIHGAPARRYLNEKVTGVLLEGMKRLAVEQPEDPLKVLGEFLLQRSRDIEGTG